MTFACTPVLCAFFATKTQQACGMREVGSVVGKKAVGVDVPGLEVGIVEGFNVRHMLS